MDTITPPRSGTVNGSLAKNCLVNDTKEKIASSTKANVKGASPTNHVDDTMDTECTLKVDGSDKVLKADTKSVKGTNSNKKAKTSNAKGDILKNNPPKNKYKQKQNIKTTQTRLVPHPDPLHVRAHQLHYNIRLQLDKVMEEPESTVAIVLICALDKVDKVWNPWERVRSSFWSKKIRHYIYCTCRPLLSDLHLLFLLLEPYEIRRANRMLSLLIPSSDTACGLV